MDLASSIPRKYLRETKGVFGLDSRIWLLILIMDSPNQIIESDY